MNNFRFFLFSLVCVMLAACENTGDKAPPITSEVSSRITHYHPSFWEGVSPPFESNLVASAEFRVTDPDGLTDINKVEVVDVTNGVTYKLVERLSNGSFGFFYNQADNVFNPPVMEPFDPNRVELVNWRVDTEDLQGHTSTRNFEFVLPDGETLVSEKFVFAPDFDGLTENGVAAMEVMTIADNSLSFTSDPTGNGTFTITFETFDLKAKNYSLWFFAGPPAGKAPVRKVEYDSASIMGAAINPAGQTEVTIPWLEIDPDAPDIALTFIGVHVVLYDAPVASTLIQDKDWFAYAGVSEFITLPGL